MFKQSKEHEVYFEKGDYQQITAKYQRDKGETFTQEQLLIVAKGFFIDEEYAQCLKVVKIINPLYSTKVLFERQSLHFRAEYLLKRHSIPTVEDLTSWRDILSLFEKQSKNVTGPPIQPHHLATIQHYKDFLILVEQRLANKIQLDFSFFKQQKTLELKTKKYEGFPVYLMANIWIEDFNNAMPASHSGGVYLSPINNFSIINDLFESYHFQDVIDRYKNIIVFPGASYQSLSKKYWNYLNTLINEGNQITPIKRVVNLTQSTISQDKRRFSRSSNLISVAVKCQEQLVAYQLTQNRTLEEQLYAIIENKYGTGQFKVKMKENLAIYDIEGPTQLCFQGFNKILYFNKVKIPKNLSSDQLRPLLKFQFRQLPEEYLSDPQNGLKGLQNIGNSCYLNSCIQCLSNTKDLVTFIALNHTLQNVNFDQKDGIVVAAFSDLLKSLWNKESNAMSVFPRKFKKAFGEKNTQFLEKTQEDAHQFLLCLLNSLHEELKILNSKLLLSVSKLDVTTDQKKVKEYFQKHSLEQNKSIIMNYFRGKMHNTMNCGFCHTQSHSYDVFLALTLPIPQKQSNYIDVYFCGWDTRQTRKYRVHVDNMKSAEDIFTLLRDVTKKKSEEEYYYIFGEVNKENLVFQEISLISPEKISFLDVIQIQDLLKRVETEDFIIYEMKKKSETQLLALIDYRYEKNGLVLGFPRMMHIQDKQIKDSTSIQLRRDIANNDRQNFFRSFDIDALYVTRPKENQKNRVPNVFSYIVQVIFKGKEKLFMGSNEIYEELNDPNTHSSIYDCFDLMRQPEVLENSWKCGNCKKSERVEKREEISSTSDNLIIHLKRFKADYRKIKTMIDYPVKGLEIDRWIENRSQNDEVHYRYDLYAVCLHTGTAEYGHYKAYCKHFVSQKWHQFDDGNVQEIDESKVVTPHAYMLFYKRTHQI